MDMEKKDSIGGHSTVPAARSALALTITWIACVAGAYTWTDQWRLSQKRERKFFSRSGNSPISELQSWTKVLVIVLQYSYFSVISRFPLKTVDPFQKCFAVLPPPTNAKLKFGTNSGYTRPTMFVGQGQSLDLCELENTPETQRCPKTFVHDCTLSPHWLQDLNSPPLT